MVENKRRTIQKKKVTSSQKKENVAEKEPAMDAFDLVRLRNYFYRDNYRRLILLLLLTLTTFAVAAFIIYYMYSHKPAPKYFATNISGGIVPLIPLNQPSLTEEEINLWAVRAAQATLSFDYVQYRTQLSKALGTYFTDTGSQNFLKALKVSLNLSTLLENHLIQIASPAAAPEIVESGNYKGRYTWVIDLPIVLDFWKDGVSLQPTYAKIRLTIIRSTYLVDKSAKNIDATRGIAINQILIQGIKSRRELLQPNNNGKTT